MVLGEQAAGLQLCQGGSKADQETIARLLSCLVHMRDPMPVHRVKSLAVSQWQEYMSQPPINYLRDFGVN